MSKLPDSQWKPWHGIEVAAAGLVMWLAHHWAEEEGAVVTPGNSVALFADNTWWNPPTLSFVSKPGKQAQWHHAL